MKMVHDRQAEGEKTEFKVRWHPFQLNPGQGETPVNKMEAYSRKFGAARVQAMVPHMQKVGAEHGIKFSYGGDISNTLTSHCLVKVRFQTHEQCKCTRPNPNGECSFDVATALLGLPGL